ncbi:glutamate receptor ionotropic, kainate glr-3-like [Hyalella azteca]|uniref:Glutamate receptor ionotropic, kainate glr-3-like n=1 Tax=Hyalella azteca TaxID=294128 RepID=A0A979FTL1_HYAAZ|nr:glutamate receptor ionotropic, kainate glr-3-like [Hyalella azteca]
MLHREEADLALATLIPTRDRGEVVDFSVSVDYYKKVLCFRSNAHTDGIAWMTYTANFHLRTWIALIGTTLLSSLVFWLVLWKQQNIIGNDVSQEKERQGCPARNNLGMEVSQASQEVKQKLLDTLFMHFGCLVQQGYHTTPQSGCLRLLFWVFWLTSVCLYASYSATLTSNFTFRVHAIPFSNLEEATKKTDWQIGLLKGTSTISVLQSMDQPWASDLAKRIEDNSALLVPTEEDGLRRARTSNFALIAEDTAVMYLLSGDCSIECFYVQGFDAFGYIPYRKAFHSQGIIDRKLALLVSGGLMSRVRESWWGQFVPCFMAQDFEELGFTHTLSAFLVLLVGIVCGAVIFLAEIWYGSRPVSGNVIDRRLSVDSFPVA